MEIKTMKERYKGLLLQTNTEDIFKDSLIVLDTNILLDFFRYSKNTTSNLLNKLEIYNDKFWITSRIATEYLKRRDGVAKEKYNDLKEKYKDIVDSYAKIESTLKNISKIKDIKDIKDIKEQANKQKQELLDNLNPIIEEQEKLYKEKDSQTEDEILNLIGEKVTPELDKQELEKIIIEGEIRVNDQMPPGYKDGGKGEKYNGRIVNGDYIIFAEMINLSKNKDKDIIFVSNDRKEDWIDKKTDTGRPELLVEFFNETGHNLIILSSEQFIEKYNNENSKKRINKTTIKEVTTVEKDKKNTTSDDNVYNIFSKINKDSISNLAQIYFINSILNNKKKAEIENIKKEIAKTVLYQYYENMRNQSNDESNEISPLSSDTTETDE